MKRSIVLAVAVVIVASTAPVAQQPAPRGHDVFAQFFYPPELVMGNQSEIGLDDEQKEAIKDAIKQAEGIFLDLKWEIHAESEKLAGILEPPRVDLEAALAQAEITMNLEREIKKTHIALLVRIKNVLTESQQQQLGQIRYHMTPPAPPSPPNHPSPSAMPRRPAPPSAPSPSAPPATASSDGVLD